MELIKQEQTIDWDEEITIKIPLGQFIQIVAAYGDSSPARREELYESMFNLDTDDISEIELSQDIWKDIVKILGYYKIEWKG